MGHVERARAFELPGRSPERLDDRAPWLGCAGPACSSVMTRPTERETRRDKFFQDACAKSSDLVGGGPTLTLMTHDTLRFIMPVIWLAMVGVLLAISLGM